MSFPEKNVMTRYPPLLPLPFAANLTFLAPPVPSMASPSVRIERNPCHYHSPLGV